MVPSGAWSTPPYPQKLFVTGFNTVAPASSALPTRLSTVLGCDTTTDKVNARNPVVGVAAARTVTWSPTPNAA